MKYSVLLNNRIVVFHNINISPENSIFVYRDNDTKQIIYKKIIITEKLSKSAHYNNYQIAHARLTEAIFATETLCHDTFLKKITRINFSHSFINDNNIFNIGMIAEKYRGYYNVFFSQKEFITDYECPGMKVTYGKKGTCHALALKWLAVQGTDLEKIFFTDLVKKDSNEISAGREEIFALSIKYHSAGRFYENLDTDASYPKKMTFSSDKNEILTGSKKYDIRRAEKFRTSASKFTDELIFNTDKVALEYMQMYSREHLTIKRLNKNELLPENSGKYEIIFSSLKKSGHHGIAIYIDESASVFKFFDPNHGEFLFKTVTDMNTAVIKLINHGKSPDNFYKFEYGYHFLQKSN